MNSAPVNKIIPFSTVDGPGNRTAVFLQGCNIACAYCHNPETQQLCRHCGECVQGCPSGALRMQNGRVLWDKSLCIGCDRCIQVCRFRASPKVEWMSPGQAMAEVEKNLPFIRGITVSGGECTLYPAFLTRLFELAKQKGLHCLLDSNGETDFSLLPDLMAVCDGVMLDVKAWEPAVYQALTGSADNAVVKKNLLFLKAQDKLEEIRIVCANGETDTAQTIDGIAALLGAAVGGVRLKLIAFRKEGVRGRLCGMQSPTPEEMMQWQLYAQKKGFSNAILL